MLKSTLLSIFKNLGLSFLIKIYRSYKLSTFNRGLRIKINNFLHEKTGEITEKDTFFNIDFENSKFLARKKSSDLLVFDQIIIDEEYKKTTSILNEKCNEVNTIVDAGGNVGYSSLYFNNKFPNSKILFIEPDLENLNFAKSNFALNKLTNIYYENVGIWKRDHPIKISTDFRDGEKWSLQVVESSDKSDLKGVKLSSLIKKYNFEKIDLLKIDIEGAEIHIFNNNEEMHLLSKIVKVISIEIHDEYISRNKAKDILEKFNFSCIFDKDLILATNNKI